MNENYLKWLNENDLDKSLQNELNAMDDAQIEEAFYKHLSFGTGGMRGIIGAGTNRMNIYTIRKAVYGYAKFLLEYYDNVASRGVVIAYDNRHNSQVFAKECVGVLSSFGIKTYLFENIRPTPLLSFSVRAKEAAGGIMVTASHNPPNYNGIKMYDDDGCQLVPKLADRVIDYVNGVEDLFAIKTLTFEEAEEKNLVEMLGRDLDNMYLQDVYSIQLQQDVKKSLKIVFTPLHGASREIGLRSLVENDYKVFPVESQMVADPDFKTVKSPNPEDPKAFDEAVKIGLEHQADILIATDPDGDRLGVAVYHDKTYKFLTGNQTGAIFIDYLLSHKKATNDLPNHGVIYNTIVTNNFGEEIAKAYGVEVISTLTGFKFIGEQIKKIEDTEKTFLMGYEESYGYVLKDSVRDKDSIQAMVLISEIANELKQQGKTLYDYLLELYDQYGAWRDKLVNIVLEGKEGEGKIKAIMNYFRGYTPQTLLDKKLLIKEDYLHGIRYVGDEQESMNFPESNVLKFVFEDFWFVLRPSGTEPKLKIYLVHKGKTVKEADQVLESIQTVLTDLIDSINE